MQEAGKETSKKNTFLKKIWYNIIIGVYSI